MSEQTQTRGGSAAVRNRPGDSPTKPNLWQLGAVMDNRWGVQAVRYPQSDQCRYCGSMSSGRDCPRVLCLACGSPQCDRPRGGSCLVCITGYLGRPPYGKTACGYKGCPHPPVADAPRVGQVCREHLAKVTRRYQGVSVTLAAEITRELAQAERGGRDWQKLAWFGSPKRFAVRRWHDDGRFGWTTGPEGAYATAGQADREAQAWNDPRSSDGWHAERVELTEAVREAIDEWQGRAPGRAYICINGEE